MVIFNSYVKLSEGKSNSALDPETPQERPGPSPYDQRNGRRSGRGQQGATRSGGAKSQQRRLMILS